MAIRVIFGAWDKHLYAVNRSSGQLAWQWNPGFSVINFSPAACTPVAHDSVVYVVCPNRTLHAIDAVTGATLWQNSETRVRESIGISEDGKYVYGKTMRDTVSRLYHQPHGATLRLGNAYRFWL